MGEKDIDQDAWEIVFSNPNRPTNRAFLDIRHHHLAFNHQECRHYCPFGRHWLWSNLEAPSSEETFFYRSEFHQFFDFTYFSTTRIPPRIRPPTPSPKKRRLVTFILQKQRHWHIFQSKTHFNLLLEGMAVHQVHVASGLNPTKCHHTGDSASDKARIMSQ